MAEYRYYLIPDAMTRAFPEKFEKQTPTEFFDNIADLEKRYHQLREMPYNNERTWNEWARFPYVRLVVGVDRQNPDGAVAIIQVRNGVNYLCDDYRGPYADGSDAQIPQMAKKLVEVIGVDRVRPHTYTQRDGYTWGQVEKDMHITELLLLCEESVQNVEVRNYTVENAQIEQGTTVAGTTAKNLKDRDGASFQVESTNKKVAWSTTVPLYYEKNDVQTIQVDYTGNTSEETNVIWLSLYRFDTQNWEVVGTIPGSTEEVTRSFVLSGNGISAYISEEGDIQIRVYNSASKEFIRYTDCVSVTTVANSQSQQKVYTPTTFVEEYGSSEGQIEKLDHIDGQSMKFHSDNNRKSAVQFEFDTDIDIDTIGEVTFVVALKSKNGANTQNLSLKNVSTGKFAVVKTASSSDNYEMICADFVFIYHLHDT